MSLRVGLSGTLPDVHRDSDNTSYPSRKKTMAMKEKRLVPQLRFPEFEGEWEQVYLKELSNLITKGTTPKVFSKSGVNYVKIEGLRGIYIDKQKCLYIDKAIHETALKRSILKENDILFAIAGATIGKLGVVTQEILPANTNQALAIIRLKNIKYINFTLQILQSSVMKKYIKESISVGAQPNLNLDQMGKFRFYIPHLIEQQKIASFLTAIDTRIQNLEKKKSQLEQYKKGVMQGIFRRNHDTQDLPDDHDSNRASNKNYGHQENQAQSRLRQFRFKDEDGKDFPEWEVVQLKNVFRRSTLKNTDDKINLVLTNSAIQGIVSQKAFFDKEIANQNNLQGYYIVEVNDFVYNPRISQNAPVDPLKRNKFSKGIMSPLYTVLKPITGNLEFLEYYFDTVIWHKYMKSIANYGARHDRMNIQVSDFERLPVSFPSLFEQTKIANFLTAIDKKISLVNEQIEKTKAYKKGLLQKMFV